VLDASTSIIVIEMPFLRLRTEMGKLSTAKEKASKEYDQERELYAGLQEELKRFITMLSSTVDLFTVKDERKARTLAEWLGGLLGLYNTVKVKQIETKEDSTRDALKTALVHLDAMDLHEKEEEKSIGEVIEKLEDTRKLMFRGSRARQAKNSWYKVRELVQAFIKVGDTAVEHRVDPELFNLVNMPAVWDKLQDELAKEGKNTAVRHYQNILQLHDDLRGVRGQDPSSVGGGQNGLPEVGRGHAPGSPGDGDDRAHRGHGTVHRGGGDKVLQHGVRPRG
jgi:hypothetical protein